MTTKGKKRPVDKTHLGNSYSPDLKGRRDRSIFNVDVHWRRAVQPLPSMLITEPTIESAAIEDSEDLYTTPLGGRYPILRFPEESPQPAAPVARTFAYSFYYEGMITPARENLGKRIDCFRASELLYLHAAARGDVRAHVGLGKIYANDHGEGHYFDALKHNLFADLVLPEEQIRAKAYEHLRYAASQGDAEGTYLLGDLLREGRGCQKDLAGALESYQTAWRIVKDMSIPPAGMEGSIAMRLGRACEEGEGCERDFALALQWYESATMKLEYALENGGWFLDIELAAARRGCKRMHQELALMG